MASWMSDTVPSLPNPPDRPPQIGLGTGFVFTTGGLAHNVTQADVQELIASLFSPEKPADG